MVQENILTYRVKGEELLSDLANRFCVRTNVLLAANTHLEDVYTAEDGEILIIPLEQTEQRLINSQSPFVRSQNLSSLTKMSSFELNIALLQLQQGIEKNNNDDYIEIDKKILQAIMDRCSGIKNLKSKLDLDELVRALNASMKLAEANNRRREVGFLSQAVIESDYFRTFEEYGKGKGKDYYPYYGRGIHQLTWEDTYKACSQALFQDNRLVKDPDMIIKDIEINIKTTAWFWRDRKPFNSMSDKEDVDGIIYRLYGGKITSRRKKVRKSVTLRRSFYNSIQRILNESSEGKL